MSAKCSHHGKMMLEHRNEEFLIPNMVFALRQPARSVLMLSSLAFCDLQA